MSGDLLRPAMEDAPLVDVPEVHLLQHRHATRRRLVATEDAELAELLQVLHLAGVDRLFEVLKVGNFFVTKNSMDLKQIT